MIIETYLILSKSLYKAVTLNNEAKFIINLIYLYDFGHVCMTAQTACKE